MSYVVHQAGLYVERVQRCVRCGEVLIDNSRADDDVLLLPSEEHGTSASVNRCWEHGVEIGVRRGLHGTGSSWFAIHPSRLDAFDVAARCRPPALPVRTTESR